MINVPKKRAFELLGAKKISLTVIRSDENIKTLLNSLEIEGNNLN